MIIEGLPSAYHPFSWMNKTEESKQKHQVNEKLSVRENSAPNVRGCAKPKRQEIKTGERAPDEKQLVSQGRMAMKKEIGAKVSRHIAELQTLAEHIIRNQQYSQARSEIVSTSQLLVDMRQDLLQATRERNDNTTDVEATYAKMSYRGTLDVIAKSRIINKIKDQIREKEINRAQLAKSLKDHVNSESYQGNGRQISAGMIDDYF